MDDTEFDKFFEVNFQLVVEWLGKKGFDDAENSCGEAMMRVYERWGSIRKHRAYLFETARNVAIEAARNRAKDLEKAIWDGSTDRYPRIAETALVENREVFKQLIDLLSQLPDKQSSVLALGLSGCDTASIAEILDMEPATVRSHRRHGIACLRREVAKRGITPESWDWS